MPRYWHELQGGTWTDVDLVENHFELKANTAADAAQDAKAALRALAMSGDMVFKCTPAALGSSAAVVNADIANAEKGNKFVRTVIVTLETAAGAVHTWYSGKRDAAAVANTPARDGDCDITGSATDITFVNGAATVVIDYTLTWAATDTSTLTVTAGTLLGYTLSDKTSIDTLVA